MIFYSIVVAVTAALLLLAFGISLLMNRLARLKRERAIVVTHEKRAKALSGPLRHSLHCLCVLSYDGTIALVDRRCQSLTRLAIAIERKRLEQKKNGPAATPGRKSMHLN